MSILGIVYCDKMAETYRVPGWAHAERYENCEDFLSGREGQKKGRLLSRIASLLCAAF